MLYAKAERFLTPIQEVWDEAVEVVAYRNSFNQFIKKLAEEEGSMEAAYEYIRERRLKRRARKEAETIGLAYWPAIIRDGFHPNIDPHAYMHAERVLSKKHGVWGENGSHGGWDSKGHHGLCREDVARMWWAAGCKPTTKFKTQVLFGLIAQKGESLQNFLNYAKGWRWLAANAGARGCGAGNQKRPTWTRWAFFGNKAVRALGRMSPPLRWAAIEGIKDYNSYYPPCEGFGSLEQPVRVRDLNWGRVAQVQRLPKWKRAKSVDMPVRAKWRALRGCDSPGGLISVDPTAGIKWGCYESICEIMQTGPYGKDGGQEYRFPAWNLTRLFQTINEVKRFASLMGKECSPLGLHDLGQFVLPESGWTVKDWRRLVFKHPEVLKRSPDWGNMESFLGHVPETLSEFNTIARKMKYSGIETSDDMEVAEVAARVGVAAQEWPLYRDFIRETKVKSYETIPGVRVSGKEIGLEGDWVIRKLDARDPIGPMLGLATNCCQHITGVGRECAKHGYSNPWSAFVVVEYKGNVVAQSWVWRSSDDRGRDTDERTPHRALVFDSVEALSNAYVEGIAALYKEAARRMVGCLGVKEVRFGDTEYGTTQKIKTYLGGEICDEAVQPHEFVGYMDGVRQWRISDEKTHPAPEEC